MCCQGELICTCQQHSSTQATSQLSKDTTLLCPDQGQGQLMLAFIRAFSEPPRHLH